MTTKQLIIRVVVVFVLLCVVAAGFSIYEVHHLVGLY